MRILRGRTPTVAVAAVATLSLGIASADRVNFDKGFDVQSNPDYGNGAIISINPEAPQPQVFGWTTTKSFEIDTIKLCVFNTTTGKSEPIGSGANSNPGAPSGSLGNPSNNVPSGAVGSPTTSARPGLETPSAPSVPIRTPSKIRAVPLTGSVNDSNIQVASTGNGGTITINDPRKFADNHGMPLYFEAVWPDGSGRSYSPAFALVNSNDPSAIESAKANDKYFNNKPFHNETDPGTTGGTSAGGSETASPPISTPTTQAISAQGGGGLSTGAIAGIAVGAGVVGLALLAALVWFLLRRNQKPKDMAPLGPFGPGRTRTDELIAEKEANTGADASPHSPYSDDGAVLGGHGGGNRESDSLHHIGSGTAAVAVAPHHPAPSSPLQQARDVPRSYTPYSDRPSGGIPSPSTRAASLVAPESISASRGGMESPAPGRATPHGLPTQYAHLVEEGMTEDEIRRLEEEERQLDAAIEQAGRKP